MSTLSSGRATSRPSRTRTDRVCAAIHGGAYLLCGALVTVASLLDTTSQSDGTPRSPPP